MDRHSWIFWSLPVGRVLDVEIRLSWMLPAAGLIYCLLFGWQVGVALFVLVFLAVLLHEYGHVMAARFTGGGADEIILSPLGGLAMAQPGPKTSAQILTAAAGPLVNLVLCAALFPGFYAPEAVGVALNPLMLPINKLNADRLLGDLALLAFSASYFLLVINVLPIIPFDGGQILHAALASRYPPDVVFRGMSIASVAVAAGLMIAGLVIPFPGLIFLGAIVLVINILQTSHAAGHEFQDDSFMGYDFSQGYTSLERSAGDEEAEPRKSSWERWKERRRAQQEQIEREQQLRDEAQLDVLLAKVHEHGYNSLTFSEKRLLQRVSSKFRDRSKRPSS